MLPLSKAGEEMRFSYHCTNKMLHCKLNREEVPELAMGSAERKVRYQTTFEVLGLVCKNYRATVDGE